MFEFGRFQKQLVFSFKKFHLFIKENEKRQESEPKKMEKKFTLLNAIYM